MELGNDGFRSSLLSFIRLGKPPVPLINALVMRDLKEKEDQYRAFNVGLLGHDRSKRFSCWINGWPTIVTRAVR